MHRMDAIMSAIIIVIIMITTIMIMTITIASITITTIIVTAMIMIIVKKKMYVGKDRITPSLAEVKPAVVKKSVISKNGSYTIVWEPFYILTFQSTCCILRKTYLKQ